MDPDLYIILRTTRVNGVVVEKDRFISVHHKRLYAETEVERTNNQIRNIEKELDGIEVMYFIKVV
jgi:hypothetical protein